MKYAVLALAYSVFVPLAALHASEPSAKPSILIILVDDMGYADTEPYGAEIKTPNLMALAQSGLRFTQFHNSAKCAPTRASLMTGLHPQQAGRDVNPQREKKQTRGADTESEEIGELDKQAVTIAEVLRPAGYATYLSGKWHLTGKPNAWASTTEADRSGWPCQRGFDRFFGFLGGTAKYFDPKNLVSDNTPVKSPPDAYITDLLAEHAGNFITEHARNQADKPFFMYLAFNAPHKQISAKDADVAAYKGVYDIGWDAVREQRLAKQKELGVIPTDCVLSPRQEGVAAWSSLKPEQKTAYAQTMATYAGVITSMDRGVGHVLAALESAKLRDNTLVIFLSDNGACAEGKDLMKAGGHGGHPTGSTGPGWANVGNTPFRYWKNTTWQGGTSTELILNWPQGIAASKRGTITREVGHVIDLMPTCVELAHATYPTTFKGNAITPMEGRSLLPILQGQSLDQRGLFWQYAAYDAARSDSWKIIRKSGGDWELFDLSHDPSEINDQAKKHPEVVKDLSAKWQNWAERVHAVTEGGKKGKRKN